MLVEIHELRSLNVENSLVIALNIKAGAKFLNMILLGKSSQIKTLQL